MKKIAIIGGGIGGLSAGIFAQRNGFESTVIERNAIAGGECTGWDRQGYHIDGCIHWLVGTREGSPLRRLWDVTGALDGVEIHHPESFLAVEHEGVTVHFYRDLGRLEESWREISPEDAGAIGELCADIRKLQGFEIPCGKPRDLMNPLEKARSLLGMKDAGMVLHKYAKISVGDLAERFRHPALREAIASFVPEGPYCAYSVVFPLGTFTGGNASIPLGGSRALAERMEQRYRSLGGNLVTGCEATGLETGRSRVVRLETGDGQTVEADYFIAACDAHHFYETLLGGAFPDRAFGMRFEDPDTYPLASNIYIGIGFEGQLEGLPRTLRFPVRDLDLRQNGIPLAHLQVTHYAYEPSFAPLGHTALTVAVNQFAPEIDRWLVLAGDRKAYQAEKERVGREVLRGMTERFPQMEGCLRLLDVATPATYQRYCHAYRGAFMGFFPVVGASLLEHPGTVPGLENLFLSGQWLAPPGGLPPALIAGKDTIWRICQKEKRPFAGLA